MEFKEAIKTRKRMCDYYKNCNCCPIEKFEDGCIITLEGAEELDEYEKHVLYPLSTERIEIDLDDGVKVNYRKFGVALRKVAALEGKGE